MAIINAVEDFLDDLRGGKMSESPIVRVEQGSLQGCLVNAESGKNFYSFLGIPYAKPPIGSLRFQAPQSPEPWEGTRDATVDGNSTAQYDSFYHNKYLGDEDCLYLNVYTPNIDGESLPVMIFLHGGAFRFGSGSSSCYRGDYLVEKDVVIVTINYRCGPLGFLCLNTPEVPGNAGLKDMVQAIKWVKNNIKCFGGNSENLTVFGQSAGALSTVLLTGSPLTKNLINKIIIQSGIPIHGPTLQKNPIDNAYILAKELGCDSNNIKEILDFLRELPAKDIVEAYERCCPFDLAYRMEEILFSPVVEKEFPGVEAFISEPFLDLLTSGRVADIPIMIGGTTLEFISEKCINDIQAFIPKDLNIKRNTPEAMDVGREIENIYFKGCTASAANCLERSEFISDLLLNIGVYKYIQLLMNVTNKPIYFYKFDYIGELNVSKKLKSNLGIDHAGHSDELFYIFKSEMFNDVTPTPEDVKIRERLVRLWTNFAKCGNPTPDENQFITVRWSPIQKDDLHCLFLGNELSMGKIPDHEKMEFWENIYTKYYKIWEHPNTCKNIITISEPETVNDVPQIVEDTVETVVETGEDIFETIVKASEEAVEIIVKTSEDAVEDIVKTNEDAVETIVEMTKEEVIETRESFVETTFVIKELNEKNVQSNVQSLVDITDFSKSEHQKIENDVKLKENNVHDKQNEQKVIDLSEEIGIINVQEKIKQHEQIKTTTNGSNGDDIKFNGNADKKPRPSNEIKMVQSNNFNPKDVIRANDPPEDDLPKNIGVNKFVNFFESLGGKK